MSKRRAPYTFKNIEDPDIVAAMGDLTARWPGLGRAADHPLTEYFIRRRGRPGYLRPLANNLRWILVSSFTFIYVFDWPQKIAGRFNMGHTWLSILVILLISSSLMYFAMWHLNPVRKMISPEQLISKNAEQNCWIWLTGIRYRDFLGIVTGYYYWLGSGLWRIRYPICAAYTLLNLTVLWILFRFDAGLGWKINGIQMLPLGNAIIFLVSDPAIQALGSLRQTAWLTVNQSESGIDWIVCICFIYSGGVLWFAHETPIGSLLYTVFPVAMIAISERALADELKKYFVRLLKARNEFAKLLMPIYDEKKK